MLLLSLAFGLLFVLLAATTTRTIGPSGDTALVWADSVPHRIVLCVERDGGGLVLATDPDPGLTETLDTPLVSNQVHRGAPGLGAILSDHAYNARLRVGPLDLPWMRNGYSSGVPDWIPRALAVGLGWRAGVAFNILLGALALVLALLVAGRVGGPWAVVVAGCLLTAEPQFHYYKKNLGATEVWLQALAVAVVALVWLAWRRGSWRPLAAAALLAGLGLHVKLSFAAVLAGLGLLGLALAAWRPLVHSRSWPRACGGLVGLVLLLAAGLAPTLVYQHLRSTSEAPYSTAWGGQATVVGALNETRTRISRSLTRWRSPSEGRGPDRSYGDVDRGGKEQSLTEVLFAPGDGIRRHYAFGPIHSNEAAAHPDRVEARPAPRAPGLARGVRPAAALLFLLTIIGGLQAWWTARLDDGGGGDARLVAWGGLLILVLPLVVRVMQPDPHHMAMVRPLLALGAGIGVAGLLGRPARLLPPARRPLLVAVAVLAGLTLVGRTTDLATIDRAQDEAVGRLHDLRNQRALAEALEELGAEHPAVLEHELMSIVEAHSRGRVRPVHYARSSLGQADPGCAARHEPAWLEAILTAHADSFLVLAWGPERSPGAAPSLLSPEEIRAAADSVELDVEPARELRDSRDRWFATIWRISRPAPPTPGEQRSRSRRPRDHGKSAPSSPGPPSRTIE